MSRYAATTEVPADRTRSEIERTLQRYGATSFAYGWEGSRAVIMFALADRRIRFVLPLPDRDSNAFRFTETGRQRTTTSSEQAYDQAVRQRWRALGLVIKAKLEAVAAEITTVEEEFLAHIVLPDGRTVGEHTRPSVAEAYQSGLMSGPLLPALGPGAEQ